MLNALPLLFPFLWPNNHRRAHIIITEAPLYCMKRMLLQMLIKMMTPCDLYRTTVPMSLLSTNQHIVRKYFRSAMLFYHPQISLHSSYCYHIGGVISPHKPLAGQTYCTYINICCRKCPSYVLSIYIFVTDV